MLPLPLRIAWLLGLLALPGAAAGDVVDAFDRPEAWRALPSDGVEMKVSREAGESGSALRLDFRFVKGGGYAVLHRDLALELPENYRFTLRLRGQSPPENLEFKLVDSTGANVWWRNQRDFVFTNEWQTVGVRRRQVEFAWGPAGGGEIRHVAAIEIAVTAGSGGAGTVWLDRLELTPLPVAGAAPPPVASASSARAGGGPERAIDGDTGTAWESDPGDRAPWLELDLGAEREFGGLVVEWAKGREPARYLVEASPDGRAWTVLRAVSGWGRSRRALDLPESEGRYLRLRALDLGGGAGPAVREVRLMPLEWGATPEAFYRAVAREAPRGSYPPGIRGERSWWTVVGVDGDREKGLLSADGALETGSGQYSVEPFLYADGALVTWADVRSETALEDGSLPIPSVRWQHGDLALTITAFADGAPRASTLVARYRLRNLGSMPRRATLFLALRPFQVNPPEQFLGTRGGTARVRSLRREGSLVRVNGDRGLSSLTSPAGFGAASFDEGDVVADFLRAGRLPPREQVSDSLGRASGALAYAFELAGGGEDEVDIEIPLGAAPEPRAEGGDGGGAAEVERRLSACRRKWSETLGLARLRLPAAPEVARALEAQIGWILVERDGAALQPGVRSYARTWIRDGALMSSALLRTGHAQAVKEFVDWFAPYQYEDGKVPCCVDARGSDPVPEHDSGGEFVFLAAEYLRYTGDLASAGRWWPAVARAAAYLDSLRGLRRTAAWRTPATEEFFGLLPPSISHEGYSAKPMHSYWDDLFALRGFADAAYLAEALGHGDAARHWAAVRDEFAGDLTASVAAAMRRHRLDYLPGCADLGDFDATSTTIALDPVQAEGVLPRAALERTFARYWDFFRDRRDGTQPWEVFTPYEMRNIGAFVRLGWSERADSLLEFFLGFRRPPGWQQWPEVIRRDEKVPYFVGDLPHAWVGSDFARSVLDFFAFARAADSTLVLGAGVPAAWALHPDGLDVRGLRTPWGAVAYTMRPRGGGIEMRIEAGPRLPPGGIRVRAPRGFPRVTVDGAPVPVGETGEVSVRALPARLRFAP